MTRSGDAPVLDPLPRWVRADVLSTGDLTIGGQTVPGEGGRAREVQQLLIAGAGADELAAAGVAWVVVEGGTADLDLPVAYRDDVLTVYAVGGDTPGSPHRPVLLAAHGVWVGQLAVGLLGMLLTRLRSRQARRGQQHLDRPERGDQ